MATTREKDEKEKMRDEGSDASFLQSPAWEQIEAGRYQPRRIRGSYRGRELG